MKSHVRVMNCNRSQRCDSALRADVKGKKWMSQLSVSKKRQTYKLTMTSHWRRWTEHAAARAGWWGKLGGSWSRSFRLPCAQTQNTKLCVNAHLEGILKGLTHFWWTRVQDSVDREPFPATSFVAQRNPFRVYFDMPKKNNTIISIRQIFKGS